MIALTWLRGLLRPSPQPSARHRRRRRGRRRAARLDRHVPVLDHVADDGPRDQPRPGRLAGRGAARRQRGRRAGHGPLAPRRRHGTAGQLRRHYRLHRHHRRHHPADRAAAGCSACRTATRTTFPGELRVLAGTGTGVLLAQQTAANLHAQPGDTVPIGRPGGSDGHGQGRRHRRPARRRLALPDGRGARRRTAAGAARQRDPAPPSASSTRAERGVAGRPTQVHARLSHALPGSPSAAYTQVSGRARNLETRARRRRRWSATTSRTALDSARQDALYAQVLFLFLGVPGAVLAGLVTASIAAAGADRRRRDAALLRTRGASSRQLVRIAPRRDRARRRRRRRARARRRRADRPVGVRDRELRRVRTTAVLLGRRCRHRGGWPIAAARSRCPPGATPAPSPSPASAPQIGRRDRAPLVGALRARLRRAGRRRARVLAGIAATATSSCSRPRASRRSRSTGTPCSRPCSAGSAAACSPSGSPTSCSPAAARRSPGCCGRSRANCRRPSPRR